MSRALPCQHAPHPGAPEPGHPGLFVRTCRIPRVCAFCAAAQVLGSICACGMSQGLLQGAESGRRWGTGPRLLQDHRTGQPAGRREEGWSQLLWDSQAPQRRVVWGKGRGCSRRDAKPGEGGATRRRPVGFPGAASWTREAEGQQQVHCPHGAGRWLCSGSFLGVRQGAAGSGFLVEWALLPLQACSFLCSPSPCLSADVSWSRS